MIISTKEIRKGKRVIIDQLHDGFHIRVQEHESICGGYVEDADKDGWRDCLISFEYTREAAKKEMESLANRY